MKKLIIVAVLVFVFGCSPTDGKPSIFPSENESMPSGSLGKKGEVESEVLKTISVSLYSTKHPEKAQPMLVKVISEPNEITIYETILKKNAMAELTLQDFSEIYYLQLEYVKNGVSEYKDILYAKGKNTAASYKEFKMKSEFNFDKFDEQLKEKFIQSIGKADWCLLTDQLPI